MKIVNFLNPHFCPEISPPLPARHLAALSRPSTHNSFFATAPPFRNKYQEPTVAEGFAEVARVNFVPEFRNADEEALYAMYLLEK